MRPFRIIWRSIIGALVALLTIEARCQDGYARAGELVTLFGSEEVRKVMTESLSLPKNKVAKAQQIAEEFRAEMRRIHADKSSTNDRDEEVRREYNAKIEALFALDQRRLLDRFRWAEKGPEALLEDKVAEKLDLSAEQREKLKNAAMQFQLEQRELINKLPRAKASSLQKILEELAERKKKAMLEILTPAQVSQWEAMVKL
jgi:hypothetical protein